MTAMNGNQIVKEAFDAFGRWLTIHDPDGTMTCDEATAAYGEWCNMSHAEQYIETARPLRPQR